MEVIQIYLDIFTLSANKATTAKLQFPLGGLDADCWNLMVVSVRPSIGTADVALIF